MIQSALARVWKRTPSFVRTHLRASGWFRALARIVYAERGAHFKAELAFYQDLFRDLDLEPRLIFDIGANSGEKTEVYVALGASVVAVEPTPKLVSYLRERFGAVKRVRISDCAVSDAVGSTTLWCVANSDAMNTISRKNVDVLGSGINPRTPDHSKAIIGSSVTVPTTTLDVLIDEFGLPDYIKIDVEGHEREVMRGLSRKVSLVSFEANLPEFLPETLEIIDLISRNDALAMFQAREHKCFLLPEWVTGNAIADLVRSGRSYLEIFVRSPPTS